MSAKGSNGTTGTIHYARHDGRGLVQVCGVRASQRLYLDPEAETVEVTCRKCVAPKAASKPRATATPQTYGRFNLTITDLREVAKDLKIPGRTRKSGDELLAEIIALRPHMG